MHKSQEELKKALNEAEEQVKVGGTYSHYKRPTETYKALLLAITEADDTTLTPGCHNNPRCFLFYRQLTPVKSKIMTAVEPPSLLARITSSHRKHPIQDGVFSIVNLSDQLWNTLWADLVRMNEELERLQLTPGG